MKEGRDFSIVFNINSHYNDLQEDIDTLDSFNSFVESKEKRRAILFDFLQIGELTNQLSKAFLLEFNNKNAEKLISIRNRIVHGYSTIRDDIIYNTLKHNLGVFINELNSFARIRYFETLKNYLGKRINVVIDRPIGFNHNGVEYKLNYGYFTELTALDGEFQDVYILDEDETINKCNGIVVGIVHRLDDIEDKLVISTKGTKIDAAKIEENISFQERFYSHEIII